MRRFVLQTHAYIYSLTEMCCTLLFIVIAAIIVSRDKIEKVREMGGKERE